MKHMNRLTLSFLLQFGLLFVLLTNTAFSNMNVAEEKHVQLNFLIELEQKDMNELQKMIKSKKTTSNDNIQKKKEEIHLSGNDLDQHLKGDLKGLGREFVQAGKEHEIDPIFLAALAAQETGWGDSLLMESPWNNVGGITCMPENYEKVFGKNYPNPGCEETVTGGTKWQKFLSIEDSIKFKAAYLKLNYLENGSKTIEEIQKNYAPSNASNDQTGLNDYWIDNIVSIMNHVKRNIYS
ncbi:glucosaminidase domain-containing protein [Litchfieldia salsa]|uniref:Beta-N-acetylglucosaminidase n=1 Tax=Litchfieldia salsa TaxID=930152 RepID=A0A1H0T8H2_9BACI|nr:glucosaminidase domain-containing protein [Litchfieldia salsa]SDP49786.1 Beta-N-acetylglucosaminidase [Litchfieldia salsa]